jgi:hypothetical protein
MKKLVLACAVTTGLVAACGCSGPPPVDEYMASIDDLTDLDTRHEDIPLLESTEWVELYRPELSWAGYNLVLYRRRVPMLIDMQGRIVHSWPNVRTVGRARLDDDGRLTVIGTDDAIKEYDWDGNLVWAYRLPGDDDFPHHDVIELANGNTLIVARASEPETEILHEVDREGRLVWRWRAIDHLHEHFPDRDMTVTDPTHINSVFEIGANRWYDDGDERFRPGNILVSARNLSAIFIIDKQTREVVWLHTEGLDHQHEAQLVPPGLPGEGHLVLFNNGFANLEAYRQSDVRAFNPQTGEIIWKYTSPTFFSSVAGVQQVLPNGNVLISASEGGRVFEVTLDKQVVWQWVPPYLPMRVHRYAADHCPQLAALGPLDRSPVERPDRPTWVDTGLSRWAIADQFEPREVYGKRRQVVLEPQGCRELLLPPEPMMQVAYGFDDALLEGAPVSAAFEITIRDLETDQQRTLVDETIDSTAGKRHRDKYLELPGLGLRRVELCLDIRVGDGAAGDELHPSIFLSNPRTFSQSRGQLLKSWNATLATQREQDLEERQLRALGYVQ